MQKNEQLIFEDRWRGVTKALPLKKTLKSFVIINQFFKRLLV